MKVRFGAWLSCWLVVLLGWSGLASAEDSWRLDHALGAPDWLSLNASYRVRYETVGDPFRSGASGSDELLAERLLLHLRVDLSPVYIGAELEDSRVQLDDAGTPLGTDDVNTTELLQAYIGLRLGSIFNDGDSLDLTAGRLTIDVGSRRFVARNRFRNTLNGFFGIHGLWTGAQGSRVQAFLTLPVNREPGERARIARNSAEFDDESDKVVFWGLLAGRDKLVGPVGGELFFFGLHEKDRPGVATRNRRLYTPGFRLYMRPQPGAWDFEVEAAYQFGTSRQTTSAADLTDLDHHAYFIHLHAGRSFDAPWPPRLMLQYDLASGDRDPADGNNNRFDTLFGARRFDFGPTGIYGPIVRANISSPGVRLELKPHARLDGYVGYRAFWLARARDALPATGLQDPTGSAGRFAGHQVEIRVRYKLLPGNVMLEAGAAWLAHGRFLREAPGAPKQGDTTYFYSQLTTTF